MVDTSKIGEKPPSPWIPETDPVKLAVLGKTVEELGELVSILGRCIIQGAYAADPVTGKPNLQAVEEEVADVSALVSHLSGMFNLNLGVTTSRAKRKYLYLGEWLDMLRGKK